MKNILHPFHAENVPIERRSGRTLAIALKAIGDAMQNVGEKIYLNDHDNHIRSNEFLSKEVERLIQKLGLIGFSVGSEQPAAKHYVVCQIFK